MTVDCHMHTPLCGHAVGEPTEYVKAARRAGIELVTFTCHTPMPDASFGERRTRMAADDLPRYREMVAEAAQYGRRTGVEVLCGIEAEIFPDAGIMARMDRLLAPFSFDFVLGSLHHQLPAYRDRLRKIGLTRDEDIIRDYFSVLSEAAESGRYDSFAHPDLIRIYGTVKPFDPRDYEEEIRSFLHTAAANDVCLEVNTSGLTKGVYELHPDPVIMRWAKETGTRFTLGSDAHKPDSVGQHFDRAAEELRTAGHSEISLFRGRIRESIPMVGVV